MITVIVVDRIHKPEYYRTLNRLVTQATGTKNNKEFVTIRQFFKV